MELVSQRNGSDPADSDRPEVIESTTVTQQDGETVTTRTVHVRTVNKIGGVNIVEKFHKNQDGPPSPDEADIDFIKRNSLKRRSLNKEAYIRLHRNVNNRNSIEVLKGRYEVPEGNNKKSDYAKLLDKRKSTGDRLVDDKAVAPRDVIVKSTQNIEVLQSKLSPKLSRDTVESLKVKYSPSNFGYPNLDEVKLRQKPALPAKPKGIPPPKSPIRTSTVTTYKIPTPLELETIPGHEVILRSSSEDSIERIESFLSEFTMDPKREVKEKKRTSSFRKILTGGLFGKDKKKNEKKHSEDKSKNKKTENVVVADNVQNEQMFNRNSSQRHTVDNHLPKQPKKTSPNLGNQKQYVEQDTNNLNEMERRYAEMHINNFNKLKASFSNPESYNKHPNDTYQYLHENDNSAGTIDKYIDTSSSSNTLESVDRSTYQNALIAQAELKQIQEKEMRAKQKDNMLQIRQTESPQNNGSVINTPPRAKEIHQNVQLVKPKALIPINSERALPNPYHNGQDGSQNGSLKKASEKNLNIDEKDYATKIPVYNRQNDFNDVYEYNTSKIQQQHQEQGQYSPNLTKSSTSSSTQNSPSSPSFSPRSSPRSPTLEGSKLRLPSNREKVNLQPRIKSPIPQPKISTEKIIATELLKNKSESKKFDTAPSPTHQKLHISSVENIYEPKPVNARLVKQSPVQGIARIPFDNASIIDPFEAAKWHQKQRQLAISPTIPDTSQVVTDAMVHVDPEMKRNSLQYSSLPVTMRRANQDAVSMRQRPVTPVKRVPSTQSLQQSPQKHEIRQSVELYCWKEIQKMKERQDQELKYQLQYTPYGYVEDPIIQRRSRSVEPIQQRSTKRSTSLPREVKSNMNSRMFYREPIPENHPVTYKEDDLYAQKNSNFVRSSPQRRTISGTTTSPQKPLQTYEGYYGSSVEVPYRPIFNRGSLNPQTQQEIQNQLQKKVSFTGNRNPAQDPSWPTKNGYVQSPPQRRMDKMASMGDDEVFLKDSQIKQVNEQIQKQLVKDSQQYATRDSLVSLPRQQSLEEAFYGSRMAGAIQSNNLLKYVNKPQPEQIINEPAYITRQNKQNTTELTKQQQENLQNIYGTRQQPDIDPLYATQLYQARNQQQLVPIQDIKNNGLLMADPRYGSKQQLAVERYYMNNNLVNESPYGSRQIMTSSPITKVTKQITVTNKVCDIYGNIHDNGKKIPVPSPNSAQIQQTGVIYGQLQGNVVGRPPQYQSYNQILPPSNFVRGNRLTASANDMYKRYPNDTRQREVLYAENPYGQHGNNFNPNGPLPPTPNEQSKMQLLMMRRNNQNRAYPQISDTESDTSEVRKIMNRNYTGEEEWNSDGKSGRGIPGSESGNVRGENDIEIRGRSRNARRDDPRRHTLAGDQQYGGMAGQGGPLARTMDLEGQPRGYPPLTNPMLFDDDPGIMSEVETSSTGFRRGGKQRSSLPVVRTPSKTLERPLGLVFLQYRNETKRALLPNEITSIDTVKALFVRSFPKQLTMEYLDSPQVKIYIHDSSKDMFYELEDLRSHLREIRDRSVLRLFESADVSGGLPMPGIGIIGGMGHAEDPSYFSEPEFDSEYQHQHIHKSKGSASKSAPYYMGSTASLPRSGLLRAYSPAVTAIPPDRLKTLPTDGYMSSPERGSRYEDPYYSQYTTRSGSITPVIDEEVSDTELLDESYSLYGVKLTTGGPRAAPRTGFPPPAAVPYDTTRIRVENMERQLANLTGLVQKALTQTPANLQVPGGRDNYRTDKSVSFEKSVSFSDEPPDMNSPKQHSPQHTERDRLKPAPPPKPASLSPGQYEGRHIYRDLQLTPEMYNQLRGLQKKAKDLRAEVRNLRRMSQAQAHSVRETIRDTFIKIRAMLLAGGEQVWQAGMDQERVRLSREEDLYKQEMLRLEKDLSELESTVEELRGNVINRKTRVNMSDVENMALILSKSSKTVADLKLRFPSLQDSMKAFLSSEMEKVVREEKFLKEEPERLESALRRCKKLTGTLVTLKRLASVQEQRLPCSTTASDGRLSPGITETPPITPTSAQHSKPTPTPRMGQVVVGGDSCNTTDSNQRPENALDALLDELQTFSKPHPSTVSTQMPQVSYPETDPPTLPVKGIPPSHSSHFNHPPSMSEIGRKGSMDSATLLPTQNLTVSTATGSLRRLHSYPSGSDTDNSPPIQPLQRVSQTENRNATGKPPLPERNTELLQHISGKRVPPPPPPRTSSKSPLASPTSPNLPPRSPATGLQHIQNVQNMVDKPQSQFEAATQNLGLGTLRRNVVNRSSVKDRAQTLPRNIGSNLQVHCDNENAISASNSSSCESVNSQDGTKKRKEELEQRHQELLKKQKALQEQYARLQQLQRGNNTLTVVPPAPDQLLKKTGSESNLLQKMGLQMSTPQMTGSLTNLPNTSTTANTNKIVTIETSTAEGIQKNNTGEDSTASSTTSSTTTTSKVYETDIL